MHGPEGIRFEAHQRLPVCGRRMRLAELPIVVMGDDGGAALADFVVDDRRSGAVWMGEFAQQQIGIPRASLHVLDPLPLLFLAQRRRKFRINCRGLADGGFGDPPDGVRVVQEGEADDDELAG